MSVQVQCAQCGASLRRSGRQLRVKHSFCDRACRKTWLSDVTHHPNWQGGERWKICQYCGKSFTQKARNLYSAFKKAKFCSKPCADKGGFRYHGEEHPNWKAETRRKNRRGKHGSWARAVIARDNGACQRCGAKDAELHAHHIKSFADHPELRWELSNGLTLCYRCHWLEHSTASNANEVNSGNIPPGNAEDNPEPSSERKFIEGVTTSGRAFRKWVGECRWCKRTIAKRLSDMYGRNYAFCSKVCSGKWSAATRTYRRWTNGRPIEWQ